MDSKCTSTVRTQQNINIIVTVFLLVNSLVKSAMWPFHFLPYTQNMEAGHDKAEVETGCCVDHLIVVQQPTTMPALWYFILGLFTQAQSSTLRLTGTVGQNVTLPCRYVKQPGVELDFCWGRGPVPTFKCSNTILSFVNGDVSFLSDHSYRLLGRVSVGDMSLTIINAQMSHAGAYGCRVELPGWFNDYKVNMELLMEEALTATEDYPYDLEDDLSTEVTIVEVGASSNALISFEHFKSLLQDGNIGRVAAIFFLSSIIILVLIFRKRFQGTLPLEGLDASSVENIYENSLMSDNGYESANI